MAGEDASDATSRRKRVTRREVWRGMTEGGLERRRLAFARSREAVAERWETAEWELDSEEERIENEMRGDG